MWEPARASAQRRPNLAAGLADDADEASEVGQRSDVRGLAGIDRPDRDPRDRAAEADAGRDHLDLELEAVLVAGESRFHQPPTDEPIARLVVRDRPTDGPRERLTAEFV